MPEELQTDSVVFSGGQNEISDNLTIRPGEAINMVNYEPSLIGGYRRLSGFTKWDTNIVPGDTGNRVLGVSVFNNGVIAARDNATPNTDIYFSTGSGWGTKINSDTRTAAGKMRFVTYDWTGTERIVGVDGNNSAFRYDGTTYTVLNAASSPADPTYVAEFKRHIFFAGHSANTGSIIFTAVLDENDYQAANGAGEIVVGDTVKQITRWRDKLIIFCVNSIHQLTGTGLSDFAISPITYDLGLVASDSVQEVGGDLYFLAPDGIRSISGTERIGDIGLASVSRKIQNTVDNITSATFNTASLVVRNKNQYRLFYSTDSVTEPNALGIIGGIRSSGENQGQWEWGQIAGIKPYASDSGFITAIETVVHGGYDGYVYQQESGTDFNSANIQSVLSLAFNILGDTFVRKTFYTIRIFYKAEGTMSLSVQPSLDYDDPDRVQPPAFTLSLGGGTATYGSGVYDTDVYGTFSVQLEKQYLVGSGISFNLIFTTDDTNSSHTLQSYELEYNLGARH